MNTKTFKISAIAAFMLACGLNASAQSSATTTSPALARIIAPITIVKSTNLNFGDVVVGATSGNVLMSASNVRTSNGGVSLNSSQTGSPTSAVFHVTGEAGYGYGIVLPSTDVDLVHNTTDHMEVSNFVSSATGILTGGAEDITVGATLQVDASQVAGNYAGSFSVTVNYN